MQEIKIFPEYCSLPKGYQVEAQKVFVRERDDLHFCGGCTLECLGNPSFKDPNEHAQNWDIYLKRVSETLSQGR